MPEAQIPDPTLERLPLYYRRCLEALGRHEPVVSSDDLAVAADTQAAIVRKVMTFDAFTPDNDPYGERDFGDFEWNGVRCYWKIDYYDLDLKFGSSDPSNPAVTARVLTILRADEY